MKVFIIFLALISTTVMASPMTCMAHFGFSKWFATLDVETHQMSVFNADGSYVAQGQYVETRNGLEQSYYISQGFDIGAQLVIKRDGVVGLCLAKDSCSICR